MTETTAGIPRTAAAIQARRVTAEAMLHGVQEAVRTLRREDAVLTVAAVARRAAVSRTFLYQNAEARQLLAAARGEHRAATSRRATTDAQVETGWRERALNAEHELKQALNEISLQRSRIAELLGQLRDLEHDLPPDGVQRVLTDNHTLKAQLRELTQDNRRLEQRLAGARDTNRFLDRRIADLEGQVMSHIGAG